MVPKCTIIRLYDFFVIFDSLNKKYFYKYIDQILFGCRISVDYFAFFFKKNCLKTSPLLPLEQTKNGIQFLSYPFYSDYVHDIVY